MRRSRTRANSPVHRSFVHFLGFLAERCGPPFVLMGEFRMKLTSYFYLLGVNGIDCVLRCDTPLAFLLFFT